MEEKRKFVDWDKVARLVLRSVPGLAAGPEVFDLIIDFQRSRSDLDEKVRRAASALGDASSLVAELQKELDERLSQVTKLRDEYSKYQQLATIEEDKARALIKQLQDTIGHGRTRERLIAFGINLLAGLILFVLGVWLAPSVKALLGIGE